MSDTANNATEEMVSLTVDGKKVQAPKGAMLIEVTDAQNINVPRFCYHKKLSISANCRMCLVEVEKSPKPMPACATPVTDGMVVHTQSACAKDAQKSVMEFLLINHPLDCPICDQGGECELQDVAVAYGQGVSQYSETKRVVFDKNIGPLIATELTRCIHCTRCVRFGKEIAGIRELGMTGRGENSLISTCIDESVDSELSGNIIDVCPVGALTAKPSRYVGRAWEMMQHKSIAPHDCLGSNIYIHTLRNKLVRVVPAENESINQVWLSDRDRFSYTGLNTTDRLKTAKIKKDGVWKTASWEEALQLVATKFKQARALKQKNKKAFALQQQAEKTTDETDKTTQSTKEDLIPQIEIAGFVSTSSTLEEQYLTQKLLRSLGSSSVDHRLRTTDFTDQTHAPVMPWLGQSIEQLEQLDAVLLIGSNIKQEQPLANMRLLKAVVNNNAKISVVNPKKYSFNYQIQNHIAVAQQNMVIELTAIASAVCTLAKTSPPAKLKNAISKVAVEKNHKAIAKQLFKAKNVSVILGNVAQLHPQFSALRTLAAFISQQTEATLAYLTEGANSAGAWLAGALPHRLAAGKIDEQAGKNIAELNALAENEQLGACLLVNIEPDTDSINAQAFINTLKSSDFVVSISAYDSASLAAVADVMLPAAAFSETSGTFVNVEGVWQSFKGVVAPHGESRPAWKILRVLANLLNLEGFDYNASSEIKDEVKTLCDAVILSNALSKFTNIKVATKTNTLQRSADVPMYSTDAIVRRASALQKTKAAQSLCLRLNCVDIERLGLTAGDTVVVTQQNSQTNSQATMPLILDNDIPEYSAWIASAVEGNDLLSGHFDMLSVKKAEV